MFSGFTVFSASTSSGNRRLRRFADFWRGFHHRTLRQHLRLNRRDCLLREKRGGEFGQAIYKQALGWIVGLIIFGLIFKGINNWAHGGGVISGILLAMLMGYNEKRDETANKSFGLCLHPGHAGVLNLGASVFRVLYAISPVKD